MPLFDPAEHEALTASTWDDTRARAGIDRIIARTVDAYEAQRFWPRNPLDDYGQPAERDRSLWIGAAGVLWALERLGAGIGEAGVYEIRRSRPDSPDSRGLMMGETGGTLARARSGQRSQSRARAVQRVAGDDVGGASSLRGDGG